MPGRVGDSPLIGAGNYADNRYSAAACVGVGELVIRLSFARITAYELSTGSTAEEAAAGAILSLKNLGEDTGTVASLLMDSGGDTVSASSFKERSYWVATGSDPCPRKKECILVDLERNEGEGPLSYEVE